MKLPKEKLRNSLTVRLADKDHDDFLRLTGRSYSSTLRELVKAYIRSRAKP